MSEFEQKEQSIRLLDEHGESLAADAREMRSANPELRVVGLILAPDASEARGIMAAIQQATGQDLAGRGFVGLVPREFAVTILRSNAPATLDWHPWEQSPVEAM